MYQLCTSEGRSVGLGLQMAQSRCPDHVAHRSNGKRPSDHVSHKGAETVTRVVELDATTGEAFEWMRRAFRTSGCQWLPALAMASVCGRRVVAAGRCLNVLDRFPSSQITTRKLSLLTVAPVLS